MTLKLRRTKFASPLVFSDSTKLVDEAAHLEVRLLGRYEPEDLLPLDNVVPDARPPKVYVEVRVAAGHGHQAVLLHLHNN